MPTAQVASDSFSTMALYKSIYLLTYLLEMTFKSHSRSLKMVPFESFGTVFYSHSIAIMAVSCVISEIKQDISRKSRFFIPPAFDTPVRGDRIGITPRFNTQKPRMIELGLPCAEESMMIGLR